MDTFNRVQWAVLAALLTALGVLGSLASLGALPGTDTESPLLWSALLRRWREHGDVAPWSLAGVGLGLAGLGLLLIRAQLRHQGAAPLADLTLDQDPGRPGVTRVSAAALDRALERDLTTLPEITRASVQLIGDPGHLGVRVRIHVRPDTDLDRLGTDLDTRLGRFTATSGLEPEDVTVAIAIEPKAVARVH